MKYQVMCKSGSTFPDTSATDKPAKVGPVHSSRSKAERWMQDEGLRSTSNREYYEKYWVEKAR